MITKEVIKSEIEKVPPKRLEELCRVVESFAMPEPSPEKRFMKKLREIKIDGPEDFAVNVDLYLSGEKIIPRR